MIICSHSMHLHIFFIRIIIGIENSGTPFQNWYYSYSNYLIKIMLYATVIPQIRNEKIFKKSSNRRKPMHNFIEFFVKVNQLITYCWLTHFKFRRKSIRIAICHGLLTILEHIHLPVHKTISFIPIKL